MFLKYIKKIDFENKELKNVWLKLKTNKYFEQYIINDNLNTLNLILNNINWKYYKNKEYIIKQNEKPKGIYFILKGSVNVFIKNERKNKSNNSKNLQNELIYVNTLKQGDKFGEKSIIDNCLTTANIISSTDDLIIGFIETNKIKDSLLSIELNEKKDKLLFMYNLIGSNFPKTVLKNYIHLFNICYLNKNDYIFKKNDNFNKIYILVDGKVNFKEYLKISIIDKLKEKYGENYLKFLPVDKKKIINNNIFKKIINFNFRTCENNSVLGVTEAFNNINSYILDCKVISDNCKFIEISKQNFFYFIKFSSKLVYFFKQFDFYDYYINKKDLLLNSWKKYNNFINYNYNKDNLSSNWSNNIIIKNSQDFDNKYLYFKNLKPKKKLNIIKNTQVINESSKTKLKKISLKLDKISLIKILFQNKKNQKNFKKLKKQPKFNCSNINNKKFQISNKSKKIVLNGISLNNLKKENHKNLNSNKNLSSLMKLLKNFNVKIKKKVIHILKIIILKIN